MINLFKRSSERAQNLSEYSLLLALIMGSLIIMGPYVIRSVNANFKGWDDSIQDSASDPLQSAPPDIVSIPGCDCTPYSIDQCGPITSPDGTVTCPVYERLQTRICPQGCNAEARCVPDSSCCTAWTDISPLACGALAIPNGDQPDGSCLDGYKLQRQQCDNGNVTNYQCVADPDCDFQCNNPAPPDRGQFCPGAQDGLTSDIDSDYVNEGECSGAQCEIECINGFQVVGLYPNEHCECLPPYIPDPVDPQRCICSPGPFIHSDFECQCAAVEHCCDGPDCYTGCEGQGCVENASGIEEVAAFCNPAIEILESGTCEFRSGTSGSLTGGTIYVNGPTPNGQGWQCAGSVNLVTGADTCHLRSLHVNVTCVPSCQPAPPPPLYPTVYLEAIGCGGGLTTQPTCKTMGCDRNGAIYTDYYDCSGSCTASSQRTCTNNLWGTLSPSSGLDVYIQGGHTILTALYPECRNFELRPDQTGAPCDAAFIGYLDPTEIVAGSRPILVEPAGCGGDYTANLNCVTPTCNPFGPPKYLDCNGNCNKNAVTVCPVNPTAVGYLRP